MPIELILNSLFRAKQAISTLQKLPATSTNTLTSSLAQGRGYRRARMTKLMPKIRPISCRMSIRNIGISPPRQWPKRKGKLTLERLSLHQTYGCKVVSINEQPHSVDFRPRTMDHEDYEPSLCESFTISYIPPFRSCSDMTIPITSSSLFQPRSSRIRSERR
jgi:hypothetical protein